jgi:hypothetical protein
MFYVTDRFWKQTQHILAFTYVCLSVCLSVFLSMGTSPILKSIMFMSNSLFTLIQHVCFNVYFNLVQIAWALVTDQIHHNIFEFILKQDFLKYVGPMDMSDKFWSGRAIFYSGSVRLSSFYPSRMYTKWHR